MYFKSIFVKLTIFCLKKNFYETVLEKKEKYVVWKRRNIFLCVYIEDV